MKIIPVLLTFVAGVCSAAPPTRPILFVTQIPRADEVNDRLAANVKQSCASPIQNPSGDPASAGRGGALMLRMPNGTVRNLTFEAGYGHAGANGNVSGAQVDANSIAVQRPYVNWDATRAVFSMVVGAPATDAATLSWPCPFVWQLYEVTNLDQVVQGSTAQITKVPNQPADYDNLQACYGTDGRILFTSDHPRGGLAHLFPQRDEYLLHPINSGVWSIDPAVAGGALKHVIHCPSGAFTPFVDSFGRLLFVQWDHLVRDVMALTDKPPIPANGDAWTQSNNGCGNYADESSGAAFSVGTNDIYPEPRNADKTSLKNADLAGLHINGNALNIFFLWMANEDGSGHEILNHVGRHELYGGIAPSFTDDPNLTGLSLGSPARRFFNNMYQMIESPTQPGTYLGIDSPDVGTHGAGQIISLAGGPAVNPDLMAVNYVTAYNPPGNLKPPFLPSASSPLAAGVDLFRNVVPLSDGNLLAVRTNVKNADQNTDPTRNPAIPADLTHPYSYYDFRLMSLKAGAASQAGYMVPDVNLTSGFTATNVVWHEKKVTVTGSPGQELSTESGIMVTYTGPLWELDPVEVVARNKPATQTSIVNGIESQVFAEEGVDVPTFQNYLRTKSAALVVNRNSTRRDHADRQQPFNLKIAWPTSTTQTVGAAGKIYDIGWLQVMQADQLRGLTMNGAAAPITPKPGRRVVPVPLHDTTSEMPAVPGAPPGAVRLADDGSFAAVVPANRAVSWHLLDGAGTRSQVKERYWVNFAPGEIRTCAVCHGVNTSDQANNLGVPTNKPQALRTLLQFWKGNNPPGVMQHAAPAAAAMKSAGTTTLSVTRTGGSVGPVSVGFATQAGTALPGADFAAASGTVSWADGDTAPKPIQITLLNNPAVGAPKSLSVALSSPVNGSLGATTTATLTLNEKPFDAWRFLHFGAAANTLAVGGAAADPDLDGFTNAVEYAFALDPVDPGSRQLPSPVELSGSFGFVFTEPPGVSGVTYGAESSTTLTSWTPMADHGSGPNHDFTQPTGSATHLFFRLTVTIN